MVSSLSFANFKAPGTRIVESTSGSSILELTSFQTVYMFGYSTSGPSLTPTKVESLVDFTNQFPSSQSENSVKLFFRNNKYGILYFIRVPIAPKKTVKVDSISAGSYTLTIAGTAVTVSVTSENTKPEVVSLLVNAVNTAAGVSSLVTAYSNTATDELSIVSDNLSTFTLTASGSMTVTTLSSTTPTASDYVYSFEHTFDIDDEYEQGFLICPEFFQAATNTQAQRTAVAASMEALASDKNFDWSTLIDCAPTTVSVSDLQTESQNYISPQGHSSYYSTYLIDLESQIVPPSAAIAAISTRRYREESFVQPAAGTKYPILGVLDVVTKYSNSDQEILNPAGINVIRNLRNKGIVAWSARTRATEPLYKQSVSRIIMNVINGTLRKGFDNQLFNSIDGQGVLLHRIEETARAVLRKLWIGGALFGNSEPEAFEVRCSFENNPNSELEVGNVLLEVYAATSPSVERILIASVKVPIGQVQQVASQLN
ncbi:MAG: phage tail sheath subtilisin-like domain-containing protein [Myxacorys californica WJT36-NPBG1]|jgi:hypothetical protein|nr:phage tail sheath subtilisin-like domain-containing protein [Myxacorys californica WJT36-NPBG1]